MRLLMIIGLGMTLAVTSACQKGGNKRAKFKSGSRAEDKPSARAVAINQALGESGKCLKVDKLLATLMTTPKETYLVYTSDLNFVEKGDQEPFIEILTGQTLIKNSSLLFYLTMNAIDEKCETVTFPATGGSKPAVFKVLNTSNKNKLNLVNTADANELLSYEYNRRDSLKITHFSTSSLSCAGKVAQRQRTWTLAYGEGLERLSVSKRMMDLFSKNIILPTEVHRATYETGKTNPTRVHMGFPSYATTADLVKEASKQSALCPK